MNTFHRNQKIISEKFQDLKPLNLSTKYLCEKVKSKTELQSFYIENKGRKIFLASRYNPQEEADAWVDLIDFTEEETIIVVGLALAYHLKKLLEKTKSKIIVAEFDLDLLSQLLDKHDYQEFFSEPRIGLLYNEDYKVTLQKIQEITELDQESQVLIHPPTLNFYKKTNPDLATLLERMMILKKRENVLESVFGNNKKYFSESRLVSELFGKAKDKTVLLVLAGPSTYENLDVLKQRSKNTILICASTIMKVLLENKIMPDYVAISDSREIMLSHFENSFSYKIPLIYIATAATQVLAAHKGEKYLAFKYNCPNSKAYEENYKEAFVYEEDTVATMMLDVAIKMSPKNIIFVGQDLALVNDRTHALGIEKSVKFTKDYQTVLANDGEQVKTLRKYLLFKKHLEKLISANPQLNYINTSVHGAFIEGTKVLRLKEALTTSSSS